jgi:hypothetical protein
MPRMCQICQKTALAGNIVSHANNKTHTKSQPNLQKVKFRRSASAPAACAPAKSSRPPSALVRIESDPPK